MENTGSTETLPNDTGSFITINERAYKYIRQFSIKNVTDAVVELLTNADDAYGRSDITDRKFYIQYHEKFHTLCIIDNAIGVGIEDMKKCFMQVGSYTSTDDSRGFFSRGAKDVSILGDVFFEAIKNGLYSKTYITANAYTGIMNSEDAVTDDIRANLSIPVNGLSVKIQLLPTYAVTDIPKLIRDITLRATLRGIFSDSNNTVMFQYFDADNALAQSTQLVYAYPDGRLLLDLVYEVPGYAGINAQFVVYKANNAIDQPLRESEMEFGFLFKSGSAIHEVSTIDNRFRWNPYINYFYGYLRCDYINALMKQIDTDGISAANPMTIIDPSRYSGLNREHPFVDALLSIPKVRLDYILRQMDKESSSKSISMNEFNEILAHLEDLGLNVFDNIPSNNTWTDSYDSNLVKAIQDDRQNYVTIERNFMLESNDIIVNSAEQNIINMSAAKSSAVETYVYMIDNNNNVIEIPTDLQSISDSNLTPEDVQTFYDHLITKVDPSDFSKHPYVYQMSNAGDLVKLFIFSHGQVGDISQDELQTIKKDNKILDIKFTKDLNMKYRYSIAIANGKIDIVISLNDPVVSQYLLASKVNADGTIDDANITFTMTSLENVSNNKSYIFLSEMFIEIFSRIIMYGKALNGGVPLNSENPSDMLRLIDSHYETTAAAIQLPITNIFNTYYMANSVKLINTFVGVIANAVPNADPSVFDAVKQQLLDNYQQLF